MIRLIDRKLYLTDEDNPIFLRKARYYDTHKTFLFTISRSLDLLIISKVLPFFQGPYANGDFQIENGEVTSVLYNFQLQEINLVKTVMNFGRYEALVGDIGSKITHTEYPNNNIYIPINRDIQRVEDFYNKLLILL